MTEEANEIPRQKAERDARLECLEARLSEIQAELARIARVLRGNGEGGLSAQVELCRERIESLQSQWKWILGMLTAAALAAAQAILRR